MMGDDVGEQLLVESDGVGVLSCDLVGPYEFVVGLDGVGGIRARGFS